MKIESDLLEKSRIISICYILLNINIGDLINEKYYNEYLKTQYTSERPRTFPFVSCMIGKNLDLIKITGEDLLKNCPIFIDNVSDFTKMKFNERIEDYCNIMNINYNLIEYLPTIKQLKYIYVHFYNFLKKKNLLGK